MRVLVVGSKDWENVDGLSRELDKVYENWALPLTSNPAKSSETFEVVHGNSSKGSDAVAESWARVKRSRDARVVQWAYTPGPVIRSHADLLIVAARHSRWREGHFIRMARRRGIPQIVVLHDDGRWSDEDIAFGKVQSECDIKGLPYPPELTDHLLKRARGTQVGWADE